MQHLMLILLSLIGAAHSSATNDPRRLWPNGIVPYKLNDPAPPELRRAVSSAIEDFHNRTCVRFIERTTEPAYLNITSVSNDGCWSFIGRRNASAPQHLNLDVGCWTKATATHNLMHAIGFWNEHQRTDRDQYVKVHVGRIERRCYSSNYEKARPDQMSLIGSYDLRSIMHYPSTTFCSTTGEAVMTSLDPHVTTMGNEEGMTDEDVRKVRILYKCESVQQ